MSLLEALRPWTRSARSDTCPWSSLQVDSVPRSLSASCPLSDSSARACRMVQVRVSRVRCQPTEAGKANRREGCQVWHPSTLPRRAADAVATRLSLGRCQLPVQVLAAAQGLIRRSFELDLLGPELLDLQANGWCDRSGIEVSCTADIRSISL